MQDLGLRAQDFGFSVYRLSVWVLLFMNGLSAHLSRGFSNILQNEDLGVGFRV